MAHAEAAKRKPEEPQKRPAVARPDLATLGGIALALAGILGGLILEKGQISDVIQGTAALIVLGGTVGAVLVTTPLDVAARAFRALGSAFLEPADSNTET